MICLICRQAAIVDGLTAVKFERGEFRLILKNVPARVCPSCGEAFLEEVVAEQVLSFANQSSEAGLLDTQSEFSNL